jgi:hypothetical protein
VAQTLQIKPKEIRAGEKATLTWNTAGTSAFVMGYGKVAGKGSATVAPASSTNFTMVAETRAGIQYNTERLLVNGAKGDDGFPSVDDFGVTIQGNRTGIGYINFQSAVWTMLQNKGYGVRGDYVPRRPYVTIYTDFALRNDLVSRYERIRARRLALAVDVYEPAKRGVITFGIRSRLEFQYRGENEWRLDKESSMAKAEATKAMALLRSVK